MTVLPEGFVPHDGGPCPVPLDSMPAVMFRDGEIVENWPASNWGGEKDWWQWQGSRRGYDIIAYRP